MRRSNRPKIHSPSRTVRLANRLCVASACGKKCRTPASVSTVPAPSSASRPSSTHTAVSRSHTGIRPNAASSSGASQRTATMPRTPHSADAERQI